MVAIAPLRLLVCTLLALVSMACLPAFAHAAASWQTGPLVESADNNCITGDVEYEAGSYLSYYADPANPPKVGDVYYVAIDVTGIGNTCAGIYADVNMILPANTSLAVSSQHPVLCYLGLPRASSFTRDTGDCPQSLPLGIHGYSLDPVHANPPFWPLPQGGTVEIQVPVVSSAPLNGTSQLHGYVQLADGEFDPTLVPNLVTIVDPAATPAAQQIGITYADPTSITSNTFESGPPYPGTTTVKMTGFIWNQSNTGNAWVELAYPDSAGDCSNPKTPFVVPRTEVITTLANPDSKVDVTIQNLFPGVAYCWRLSSNITSGPTGSYYGNWEYFVTAGAYNPNLAGVPPAATPTGTPLCSSNGSGCSTSNCTLGSNCAGGGGVGGLSHMLHITVGGTGSGRVTGAGGIACPGTCARSYPRSASPNVTLTATPAAGSRFTGWSGGGCSGTGTCTVKMNADQSVTATFSPPAPSCSLSGTSRSVPLKKTKHGGKAGVLAFKVRCNQHVNLSLTAALVEKLNKKHSKTFHLGPVRGSARPGAVTTLSLKLPSPALRGLKQRKHESLTVSLSATNSNGTGHASVSIGALKHSG